MKYVPTLKLLQFPSKVGIWVVFEILYSKSIRVLYFKYLPEKKVIE